MQPQSPNPDFDFMLKNQPPAKRGLPIAGSSKMVKIIAGVVVAVLLLVIISSLSGHKSGGTQDMVSAVARNQEILRVTQLAQTQFQLQDPGTQSLAATVSSSLSSDQQAMVKYLADNKTSLSKQQLAADTDKTADAQMQSARQNNQLDSAYQSYVKTALAKYQSDLQTAFKSLGPKGQAIVKTAYDSAATILNSAPLKS
jgi:hypothetical protein